VPDLVIPGRAQREPGIQAADPLAQSHKLLIDLRSLRSASAVHNRPGAPPIAHSACPHAWAREEPDQISAKLIPRSCSKLP
jgi:hypothetical protein